MKAQLKCSPSQLKLDTKLLLQPIFEDRISAKVRTYPLDYAENYSALSKGQRLETHKMPLILVRRIFDAVIVLRK